MKPFAESSHSIRIRRQASAFTASTLIATLLLLLGLLALRSAGSPTGSLEQAGVAPADNGARLSASQAATAAVYFDQPLYVVAPGEAVTASLLISGAEQLGAWELRLAVDASRAQLAQISAGDFLSSTGRATSLLGPLTTDTAGQVAIGSYSYGAQAGVDGAGALARLTFQVDALASGLIDVSLSDLLLVKVEGNTVSTQPGQGQGAVIQVSGDAAVGGVAFLDTLNANGVRDPGEDVGVANATVVLTDTLRGLASTQATGMDGSYLFTDLLASDYSITVLEMPGLLPTTPLPQIFSLSAGQADLNRNFGFIPTTGLSLASFEASASAGQVLLDWQVMLHGQDAPGFHVWRSRPGREWTRLTQQAVPGELGAGQSARYRFVDRSVEPGRIYQYQLIAEDGSSFGPWLVRAHAGRLYLPLVNSDR